MVELYSYVLPSLAVIAVALVVVLSIFKRLSAIWEEESNETFLMFFPLLLPCCQLHCVLLRFRESYSRSRWRYHRSKTLPAKIVVYEVPIRVRLINIDAPEKNNPLVAGQPINLKPCWGNQFVSYTQTDRYGRVTGRVVTANGTANRQQVLKGLHGFMTGTTPITHYRLCNGSSDTEARLWADSNPVPPWEWRHKQN